MIWKGSTLRSKKGSITGPTRLQHRAGSHLDLIQGSGVGDNDAFFSMSTCCFHFETSDLARLTKPLHEAQLEERRIEEAS